MKRPLFVLLLATVFIQGCATQWEHPSADHAQFFRDKMECEGYSQSIQRTIVQSPTSNAPTSYDSNCYRVGNQTQCRTTENRNGAYANDVNQQARQAGSDFGHALAVGLRFEDCMRSKQYSKR
jgi:hypothetical protein